MKIAIEKGPDMKIIEFLPLKVYLLALIYSHIVTVLKYWDPKKSLISICPK